jgi:hypothetical protein
LSALPVPVSPPNTKKKKITYQSMP